MKKKKFALLGALTGICNGLFGSGGGVVAVPLLQKSGVPVKKSHATSLALTLPLSLTSVLFYEGTNNKNFGEAAKLAPFGLAGALIGVLLMKKISPTVLKKIFGVLLVIAGGRMLLP